MKKIIKKINQGFEYILLKSFMLLACLLGRRRFLSLGEAFGKLLWQIGVRKKVAIMNLTVAFGKEKSQSEIHDISRRAYINGARYVFDFIYAGKMNADEVRDIIRIEENQAFRDLLNREGTPCFILGYHYSHLNLYNFLSLYFDNFHVFSGRQRNSYCEKEIRAIREKFGMTNIPRLKNAGQVMKKMIDLLREGALVGLIGDVNDNNSDLFAPFFGVQASMPKGFSFIPYVTKSRIFVAIIRDSADKLNYNVEFTPIEYNLTSSKEQAMQEISLKYNQLLEQVIRENPDRYFWFHKRWKARPQGEEASKPFYS